jgi:hypothetical protein
MSNKINIILAMSKTCPHCINFEPIWNATIDKVNNSNYQLGGTENKSSPKLNFESYDMNDNNESNQFIKNYHDLYENLEGYPTVYIQFNKDGNLKSDTIDHTAIDLRSGRNLDDLENDAVNRFLKNIENKYNTLKSEKKDIFLTVQNGGKYNNLIPQQIFKDELEYKHKYLKYKAKYLALLNNQ